MQYYVQLDSTYNLALSCSGFARVSRLLKQHVVYLSRRVVEMGLGYMTPTQVTTQPLVMGLNEYVHLSGLAQ